MSRANKKVVKAKQIRTVLDRHIFQSLKDKSKAEEIRLNEVYVRSAKHLLQSRAKRLGVQRDFLYFAPSGDYKYVMLSLPKHVWYEVRKAAKTDNVSISLFMFNALLVYYRNHYKRALAEHAHPSDLHCSGSDCDYAGRRLTNGRTGNSFDSQYAFR